MCRRVGSIQQICFNFRSEAEGLISAALSCVNRGIQVEACIAATPGYRNAARSRRLRGLLHCSYSCGGISAPREVSQAKNDSVVLSESADFILVPLNARVCG
jgi:hypothetical protein